MINQTISKTNFSFYDLPEWKEIIQESTGLDPYIFDNNLILFQRKQGLFGSRICQMPFGDYSGLINQKILYSIKNKFKNYDINIYSNNKINAKNIYSSENFVYFVLNTEMGYENLFKNKLHKKTRNMIRKAIKQKIKVIRAEKMGLFYDIYLQNMKKLGALPLPKKVYDMAFEKFKNQTILFEAHLDKHIIAYLWAFKSKQTIWIWANVSLEKYLNSGCNYALYNQIVRSACGDKNIKQINFGASSIKSPQAFFKSRWGGEERTIYLYSNKKIIGPTKSNKVFLSKMPIFILHSLGEILYRIY